MLHLHSSYACNSLCIEACWSYISKSKQSFVCIQSTGLNLMHCFTVSTTGGCKLHRESSPLCLGRQSAQDKHLGEQTSFLPVSMVFSVIRWFAAAAWESALLLCYKRELVSSNGDDFKEVFSILLVRGIWPCTKAWFPLRRERRIVRHRWGTAEDQVETRWKTM